MLNKNRFISRNLQYKKWDEYTIINIVIYFIPRGLTVMDTRLLVIAAPLLVAASWALYNIGRLAIQQIQRLSA